MSYELANPAGFLSSGSASAMIATQLAAYVTSNSLSAALAAYVTSNSLSAAFQVGLNSGMTMLGVQNVAGLTTVQFSGSWSHIGVLQMDLIFNCGVGAAIMGRVQIGNQGGGLFLGVDLSATASGQETVMIEIKAMGGDGKARKALRVMTARTGSNVFAATTTANTSFVGKIGYDNSATMVTGVAYVYGLRNL